MSPEATHDRASRTAVASGVRLRGCAARVHAPNRRGSRGNRSIPQRRTIPRITGTASGCSRIVATVRSSSSISVVVYRERQRHARRARARAIAAATGLEPAEPESSSASRRTAPSSHSPSTSESLRSSRLLMSWLARCARASGARRMASLCSSSMVIAAPRRPNQGAPVVYAPAPTARTRSHGIDPDEVAWTDVPHNEYAVCVRPLTQLSLSA